ncbi:hypothetical protein [Pleomorphovibrio marinus]|uniref:hypothetical protein n=1 Tax=Pleomorphovibrio marinus TaxID=2164132 RepID=UPI000E0A48B0|nr:hypothetical protein [Pleomorphovibrio marinus]
MIRNCNDGTGSEPYLRADLNIGTCNDLPEFSTGPKGDLAEKHMVIKDAGFAGVQDGDRDVCRQLGLKLSAHARINELGKLEELVKQWKSNGYDCSSLHVGWGMESDDEIDRFLDEIISLSQKYDYPIFLETHRATITQDMFRTVKFVERFPEIRFNGDFSHWYTGQEMVYGGIENKWEFIHPVLERVRFIHARIGNPGCIQVAIREELDQPFVSHFKEMWVRCIQGFMKSAQKGDFICFVPELLPADIYYARAFEQGEAGLKEESDRWEQAIKLKEMAKLCWEEALLRMDAPNK